MRLIHTEKRGGTDRRRTGRVLLTNEELVFNNGFLSMLTEMATFLWDAKFSIVGLVPWKYLIPRFLLEAHTYREKGGVRTDDARVECYSLTKNSFLIMDFCQC